jgi:molybdate transport system ATP-binding protein
MSLIVNIKKRLSHNFLLNVNFESEGFLGILGASGCGKSMTLKCIAGIEKPDEGFILLDGRVLFDSIKRINIKPQERRVGYLFQNYALFPQMNALKNIMLPLNVPKVEKEIIAEQWIEKFGLHGLEKRLPHELSGGQQQRAALARMLIASPLAVLLDEPFSALDSELREYMQLEFLKLVEAETSSFKNAILVTHSRDEVYRLCPNLAIMDNGKIITNGSTHKIFDNPKTVASARLTGCKNISKIIQKNDHKVYAVDWGVEICTDERVGDKVTHIGIRAHNFISASNSHNYNRIAIDDYKRSCGPFEELVVFTNKNTKKEIWWKFERQANTEIPKELFLPPAAILLLE